MILQDYLDAFPSTSSQFSDTTSDPAADQGTIESILDFLSNHWWQLLLLVVLLIAFAKGINIVREKTAIVIEPFGKYSSVKHAGLRLLIPGIDKIVQTVSLQIQQLDENIKVKTSDDVFVTLPVTVQYRVEVGSVDKAYYELEDPEAAIGKLILNDIRSTSVGMTLEQVFQSRDSLATGVETTLTAKLGEYGYVVEAVLVDNPQLSDALEASFDSVMAAQREQDAATAKAEALKITEVGIATANAEGLKISAAAQVEYRNIVAKGHAAAIKEMSEGTNLDEHEALRFLIVTDSNDAIRDAARSGATIVVASPTPSDGLYATLPTLHQNGSVHS